MSWQEIAFTERNLDSPVTEELIGKFSENHEQHVSIGLETGFSLVSRNTVGGIKSFMPMWIPPYGVTTGKTVRLYVTAEARISGGFSADIRCSIFAPGFLVYDASGTSVALFPDESVTFIGLTNASFALVTFIFSAEVTVKAAKLGFTSDSEGFLITNASPAVSFNVEALTGGVVSMRDRGGTSRLVITPA